MLGAASLVVPAFTRPTLAQTTGQPPINAPTAVPAAAPAIDLGTGKQPYKLDVALVEIQDRYEPPFRAPNVEHQFREPPARLMARWATQRLVAVGNQRIARFIIADASVIEAELPTTGGIRGMFTTQQDRRFDAKVAVAIEIRSFGGNLEGRCDASAMVSKTLSEKATLDDRDALFEEIDRELVALIEPELEKGIKTYLAQWVR
ncbi:hypothetical protein [Desertibaculum subflavum]|uniref:hypothetical protein n=1 Tax=Desertibaculum subflavum TaxID=2268458 RepID=UPI000E670C7C